MNEIGYDDDWMFLFCFVLSNVLELGKDSFYPLHRLRIFIQSKLNIFNRYKIIFRKYLYIEITLLWSDEAEGPVKEVPRLLWDVEVTPPLLPCFCCFNENPLDLSLENNRLFRSLLTDEAIEVAIAPLSWNSIFFKNLNN